MVPGALPTVGLPGRVLDIVKCTSVDRQLATAQGSELRINTWEEVRTSCD